MELRIKKLVPHAKLPAKGRPADAAYDLYAAEDTIVPARSRAPIKTGISIAFPPGYVVVFRDRSGLAAKEGLTIMGGVIDPEYRGEYIVLLYNTTDKDYCVKQGDRICQAIWLQLPDVTITEVDELEDTHRGENGFGSSGK